MSGGNRKCGGDCRPGRPKSGRRTAGLELSSSNPNIRQDQSDGELRCRLFFGPLTEWFSRFGTGGLGTPCPSSGHTSRERSHKAAIPLLLPLALRAQLCSITPYFIADGNVENTLMGDGALMLVLLHWTDPDEC